METLWQALERAKISVYGPAAQTPGEKQSTPEQDEATAPEEMPVTPEETPAAVPEENQAAIPEESQAAAPGGEVPAAPAEMPAPTGSDMPAPPSEAPKPSPSHAIEPLRASAPASTFDPPVALPVTRYIRGPFPIPFLPGQVQYIDTIKVPLSSGHTTTMEFSILQPAPTPSPCAIQSDTETTTSHSSIGRTLRTHSNRSVDILLSSNIQSPLLCLAPELRNKIYRYALVDSSYVTISSQSSGPPPPEPGLLATCRQIRSEAKAIYYLENKFHFEMLDYDASAYIKWSQRSNLHYKTKIVITLPLSIPPNNRKTWENAMLWLEARYEKRVHKCPGPKQDTGMGPGKLVGQLVVQFRELRDKDISWSTIREDFERSRRMVALFDPAWRWEE